MNKYRRRFAFLLPLTLAAGGCVNDPDAPATSSVTMGAAPYVRGDISTLTYRAVDLMLAGAPEVGAGTPLVVASISDIEQVETSSPLGNIVSDMIRTRLAQDGHTSPKRSAWEIFRLAVGSSSRCRWRISTNSAANCATPIQ